MAKECKQTKEDNHWYLTDEEWKLLDSETTVFIFEQGEKYLNELCEVSKSTTSKCYTLIGIMFAVCPFIISTAVSLKNQWLLISACIFAVACIIIVIMLYGIIKPHIGHSIGRSPKELVNINFLGKYDIGKNHNKEDISYIKYELSNLQNKIEETEKDNEIRCHIFKNIIWILLLSFSVFLLTLIINFFLM